MIKKTINVSELVTKYVNAENIKELGCFMYGCNGKSNYVKISNKRFPMQTRVFHCHIHKTKEHLRIIFNK